MTRPRLDITGGRLRLRSSLIYSFVCRGIHLSSAVDVADQIVSTTLLHVEEKDLSSFKFDVVTSSEVPE